ncbi:SDR family oxidoreductase [Lederbergia citrea]|uniref:SDR family oxidoreductase n=1 Tax=Lederbergia citrea TaxID=2833581 RepID=A0A942ULF2_9BACI|nr:SDR family oxidoreductase [Lederbergia citrea]MBS4203999.1 SDR family oxidoreductase [Lederbergia citrea]MBS4221417.1 SDR family oxidoreductase [Lederbergia citrea]
MKIFITGANRGLGLALASTAVERGHTVIAGSRDGENPTGKLKVLQERFPDKVLSVSLDVTSEQSISIAANQIMEKEGSIDAIINNAGVLYERDAKIEDLDFSLLELTMNVNLYGPMRVMKHFLPLLKQGTNQTVINISSDAGSIANAYGGDYPYAISKTALNMFSKQLNHYLSNQQIRVYAVHPGWIKTDMGGDKARGSPIETASNLLDILEKKKEIDRDLFFINHRGEAMPL